MKVAPPPRALSTPAPGRPAGQAPPPRAPWGRWLHPQTLRRSAVGLWLWRERVPQRPWEQAFSSRAGSRGELLAPSASVPGTAAGSSRLRRASAGLLSSPLLSSPLLSSPLLSSRRAICFPPKSTVTPAVYFRSSCEAPPRDPCVHRDPAGQGDTKR